MVGLLLLSASSVRRAGARGQAQPPLWLGASLDASGPLGHDTRRCCPAPYINQTKEVCVPVPGTTLTSLRPLIQGTNGVVVSSHPAAAMAGLDILRRGGNAIDAGVAVGLALNVVHAHECNFLGVAPTIMYLADRRAVITIDGLGVGAASRLSRVFSAASSRQTPRRYFAGPDPRGRRRVVHRPGPVWHHALC